MFASVRRQQGARIARIRYVTHVVNHECNDGAGARLVHLAHFVLLTLRKLKEQPFSLRKTIPDSFDWIAWEMLVLDNLKTVS